MSTEKMRMRTGMLLFAVLALSVGTAAGQQRSNSARASQPQVRVKPTPTRTPAPRIKSGEVSAKPQVDAKPPQVSVKPTAAPGPRRANPAGQAALPPRVSVKPTATPAPRRTETERPVKPPTGAGAAAAADPALKDAVSAAKLKYSQDLVRRSQQAQATGDLKGARSVYDEARQAARDENAPHLEAQAALRYAQTLEAQGPAPSKPTIHMKGDGPPPGSSAPDSSATFREAREAYAQVIQIGTPQQRVQAQNNTAVLALREGKPQEAVAVLKDVDVNALEPEQRYLYNYNYGRALELAGNTSEAYGRYARVLEAEPGYDPAIQGAFRVLTASRPPRFLEAAKLAQALLARGERQAVAREVRRALEASPSAPDAQRLLAILVEYYAAARFEPAEFQAEEGRALTRLAARSAVLDAPIRQMAAAVKGEVPILLDRGAAGGFFPAWVWDQWKTEPFSRFLKTIGDSYDRADQPRQALARYAAAWALDSANTEAALYAAVILSDHSTDLDPSGKLLDRLTEGLFDDKMAAYRKLDWVNVLRLHTVLGDIFERQDKWGPPGNPRSAVFQWTAALRAESEVRKVKPGFQPSPGLYLRLGNCYQRLGDREAAWNGYVKASYAFLKISKPEEAAGALERSRALGVPVTAEKEKTLRSLESALDDSRKSRKEGVRFAK